MKNIAIYPGTFDPPTNGHIDIISRARRIFGNLTVGISTESSDTMFSAEERLKMMTDALRSMDNITIELFGGLLTSYVEKKGALVVVRGLRVFSDFEYEFQMALMNRRLKKDFEVIFLAPREEYTFLSSSLIKEVAGLGGDVRNLVPANVHAMLEKRKG